MISLEQIALAINEKLIDILPDIPIQSTDISEGFQRPSLFVDLESSSPAKYGYRSVEKTIGIVIYYFPEDRHRNKLELLRTQSILEGAFTGHFAIKEGFVVYLEPTCDKVDGVLQCRFDIYYIEVDATETGEDIQSLELSIHKEE